MRGRKTFFYMMIVLSILSTLIFIGFKFMSIDSNGLTSVEINGEITLKESIEIGLSTAKKWDKNAVFYKLTSVDEKRGGTRGDTGKRYAWSLFFMVPGTDRHLNVGISNGTIVVEEESIGPYNVIPIELDNIQFDSPKLLKIARNKYELQKGEDWATGYHFTLDTTGDKPTVTVVGIDKDKLFTKVDINPENGKIIGAIHKVPLGGGVNFNTYRN